MFSSVVQRHHVRCLRFRELGLLAAKPALGFGYLHALSGAGAYEIGFKLSDHGEDVEQQPPDRVRGIVDGSAIGREERPTGGQHNMEESGKPAIHSAHQPACNTRTVDLYWGLSGTAWTGIYTIITFCLLIVAVAAALYARKQWHEARKARIEASRPYVVVTIESSGVGPQLFDLMVKNIGQRPALNVSITLDPAPTRARETEGHEIGKIRMLNEPVALLAPSQEMRAFYDDHTERVGRDDLPSSHQVSLTYTDSSGHKYSESSVLDIEAMKGAMFTSVHTIHDIGKSLEKMNQTFGRASVLRPTGKMQAEVSVESRAEQERRTAEENARERERSADLLKRLGFDNSDGVGDDEPGRGTELV